MLPACEQLASLDIRLTDPDDEASTRTVHDALLQSLGRLTNLQALSLTVSRAQTSRRRTPPAWPR